MLHPWRHAKTLVIAVCLAAAAAGLVLGHTRGRLTAPNPYTMLPTTFAVWDREPMRRHLTLAFLTPDDFERRRAYQNKSTGWLLSLYACLKPLQAIGIPYTVGQNAIMFVTFAAIVLAIAFAFENVGRLGTRDAFEGPMLFGLMVLAVAVVGSLPSFWVASFIGNPEDQNRFWATVTAAYVSVLDFTDRPLDRVAWIAALVIALVAPMYAPFVIVTLWTLGAGREPGARGLKWPNWRMQMAVLTCLTAIGVTVPYLMLRLGGFTHTGSGVLFRSGLDGATTYFTTMVRAVLVPFDTHGRAWAFFPLPAVALAAACGMSMLSRSLSARMLRQLFVAMTPCLFWIVLFPQVVSIHPYYFDFGLIFPAAFCLAFWFTVPDIQNALAGRRALILASSVILTGLLVTNLIDMARLR